MKYNRSFFDIIVPTLLVLFSQKIIFSQYVKRSGKIPTLIWHRVKNGDLLKRILNNESGKKVD